MKRKQDALASFEAGIAEANRRERGSFDGLLGQFDQSASTVLRDILSDLRGYLLDKYSDDAALALLSEHEPPERKPQEGYRNTTRVSDDVRLVLRLFNSIRSAARCDNNRFAELILGRGGARDKKRQEGTHKPRRPDIDRWLEEQLRRNPGAKSLALWSGAPDWLTDQIGVDRFKKRVTAARKKGRK